MSAKPRRLLLSFAFVSLLPGCRRPTPAPSVDVVAAMGQIVADFRGVIALLGDAPSEQPDDKQQEDSDDRTTMVAWLLSEHSHEQLALLSDAIATDEGAATAFLTELESSAALHDADKLAFRDALDALPATTRTASDRAILEALQARYDTEVKKIFGRLPTPGMRGTSGMLDRREAWDDYLAFVRGKISRDALMAAHEEELGALEVPGRGAKSKLPWRDDGAQITGKRFADKTVLLTFDDGPSARYTPAILDILARFGVHGVFFEVGRNVGKASEQSRRVLAAGHALANHSFTHAFLPKLGADALSHQFVDTNQALETATKQTTLLFRPPYGARNEQVLKTAGALGMKTVLWNVDSMDWADPVPQSIANRVVKQVERQKHGIILFHDIHERTTEALPLVLTELQKRGYAFLSWDGHDFVAARGAVTAPVAATAAALGSASASAEPASADAGVAGPAGMAGARLYRESWAVVVGINAYKSWPRLSYAVNDAQSVRDALVKKYGFPADHVTTLLDGEATRERILSALGDNLTDGNKVTHDDRVFVFFAGHGVTRKLPSGKSQGYLVPVDASATNFQSQAISMTNFQDVSDAIPAKHVFFVMDACYSGLALTRGAGAPRSGDRRQYLLEITRRQARQVLTAGGGDEQVADNGPGGHSIFTWTLLQGLEGQADLDGDGVITANELGAYVAPGVSSLSRQTPAFGNLAGSEGGEFVFVLKPEEEFLGEESHQLDGEAIELNAQLERVRKQIEEKKTRNNKLKGDLTAAQRALAQTGATTGTGTAMPTATATAMGTPADAGSAHAAIDASAGHAVVAATASATAPSDSEAQARREVQRGMSLYREKRYAESAQAFEAVLVLHPGHVMATNNLGFIYFKVGRLNDAVTWYQKAIALDPKRAIAYANLGDVMIQLNRPAEAKAAYQKYLELQPHSKLAAGIEKKLAVLP